MPFMLMNILIVVICLTHIIYEQFFCQDWEAISGLLVLGMTNVFEPP